MFIASVAGGYLAREPRRKGSRDWKAEAGAAPEEHNWGGKNWFSF